MTGQQYRYAGTCALGATECGVFIAPPGQLAGWVRARYDAGWRELAVCTGPGKTPPGRAEERAGWIGPDPGHAGARTWGADSTA